MKTLTQLAAATLFVLAVSFTTGARAQNSKAGGVSFSIGIEPGIPTGNATDISSFEIGGTARLEYGLGSSAALMLTAGYYDFIGKADPNDAGVNYPSLNMVPVKLGIKYYIAPSFYIDGEAGFGFDTDYENHTKLILSPGVGFASHPVDIGLRYENYSGQSNSFGMIGLRVAYSFGM